MRPSTGATSNSKSMIQDAWQLVKNPIAWWLFVSMAALSFAPSGWSHFIARCGLYFDAGNYTGLAINGYQGRDDLSAFYPLWPLMLRVFSSGSTDQIFVGILGSILAALCFGLALLGTVIWTRRSKLIAFEQIIFALLILNPLSVFRVLPFTESIFSLLLVLLILDLTDEARAPWRVSLWAAMLSATRPLFPILMIAAVLIWVFLFLQQSTTRETRKKLQTKCVAIFFSAPLGYIPFGWYWFDEVGSFWRPFTIQENWDRHFGFHWDLITSPKVINGSNEVLVWDLLSFYAPVVILITGLILFWRQPKQWSLPVQVGFLMATLIACAHSGLAFLTHDRFMSLGRHVLANPLLFMAGLVLLQATPQKHEAPVRNILRFLLVASVVFLGMWWFRFTREQWIG